jgi:hypothetical protein
MLLSNAKQSLKAAFKDRGTADMLSIHLEAIFNNWTKVQISDNGVKN